MTVVAEVRGASKEYKTGDTTIVALQPTNAEFKEKELTLIIGPSGSGKTTLLSLIGCVIYPSSGEVYINGQAITTLSEKELAKIRLQNIGFVFQSFNLLAPLPALDNVMHPMLLMGISRNEARQRAETALEKVGMTDRMYNLPKMLSGGQQQRVAIARALVTNPRIILCDEPTASLDVKSVSVVMAELKQLAESGKSVTVVTHDLRLKQYADRIIYVNDGVASDTPSEDEEFVK
ncbi:putative ABC transport system ATP-binding protein [Larkinella arboricola]|uniref:Putative ABC transport system ATP-binding protein n=1 Tax=Larkinella arboricola TaxID=643671 RepID=A0A327WND8_LARAB|nr:ABC transporter ATP-binding protein [Larkinella arboricola]RAJ93014.1 putative ABC transport system ATP-binding protein [Larkinella arboricola]